MEHATPAIRSSIDVAGSPQDAFDSFVDDFAWTLDDSGLEFNPEGDARVTHGENEVGRVTSWVPGQEVRFEWRPASWGPETTVEIVILFETVDDLTRITVEHRGLDQVLPNRADQVGWFATEVAAPQFVASSPDAFGDWLTDREGRRPTGEAAREEYGDPLYHYPNFRVLIEELGLVADDYLIEVGCGGGALLSQALESGCQAAAIDHSPEMVRLAEQNNRDAVASGQLIVREAAAETLPFDDGTFTCATMTGVLGHLPDPDAVFAELYRVLDAGGRVVILGSDPELQGTPAAPEPMASRMTFYESDDLEELAQQAGFEAVRVVRRNLESYARDVGVPEEHLPLYDFPSRFLRARKSPDR